MRERERCCCFLRAPARRVPTKKEKYTVGTQASVRVRQVCACDTRENQRGRGPRRPLLSYTKTKQSMGKNKVTHTHITFSFSIPPYRYKLSDRRLAAISGSHRSPLSSSFCLSYRSSSRVSVQNSKLGPSTMASTGHASWQKPQ